MIGAITGAIAASTAAQSANTAAQAALTAARMSRGGGGGSPPSFPKRERDWVDRIDWGFLFFLPGSFLAAVSRFVGLVLEGRPHYSLYLTGVGGAVALGGIGWTGFCLFMDTLHELRRGLRK